MRLDKYLKVSHIIKRRTVAKEAASKEKIYVNGKLAKPSTTININDIIEIHYSDKVLKVCVLNINEYAHKDEVKEMYEVIN